MFYFLLVALLATSMVFFLRQQLKLRLRIAAQKSSSREELIPRHYKKFTEVERKLWEAVQNQNLDSDQVRFIPSEPQFAIIREYVRGVREDFRRAQNIWGQIIIHCPEGRLLAQLEWERIKSEFVYYRWWLFSGLSLRATGISIGELRQLTEIVASISYRVRTLLNTLEQQGDGKFVDSILRQS